MIAGLGIGTDSAATSTCALGAVESRLVASRGAREKLRVSS